MGDVGQRIFQLALGERAMAPVGEARRFVDLDMGDLARQGFVGRRIAEAAHHRRHLGVEQGIGQDAALQIENLDVLARGVQHLDDVGPPDQVIKGRQIEARGQGIDDRLPTPGAATWIRQSLG